MCDYDKERLIGHFFGGRVGRWGISMAINIKHTVQAFLGACCTFFLAILWQALYLFDAASYLTYWGRDTHMCVSNLVIICLDNGVSPGRRQAIISTNADIFLIRPLTSHFSQRFVEIIFLFKKMPWKMVVILYRPQCVKHLKYLSVLSMAIHYFADEERSSLISITITGNVTIFCQPALETYMINSEKVNLKLKIVLLALGPSPVSKK